MQIENAFTVPTAADRLWSHLLDVERIAPCLPGAEITETVDERTWKGRVTMKLGPVSLAFAGTVSIEERDDVARRVVLRAKGMEQRGKGAANASVTSWLEPAEDETTVRMVADIQLTGAVAQLSRGLLPEVSRKLTAEFAECLRVSMLGEGAAAAQGAVVGAEPAAERAARPASAPIKVVRLGLSAFWAAIVGLVRRLFRGREPGPGPR